MHAAFINTSVYINRGGQVKDNVKLVSDEELKVMRQGNRISVDSTPQLNYAGVQSLPRLAAPHPGFPLQFHLLFLLST